LNLELRSANNCDQDLEQQKLQPPEQEAEVVSDGGEHDVDGIADTSRVKNPRGIW